MLMSLELVFPLTILFSLKMGSFLFGLVEGIAVVRRLFFGVGGFEIDSVEFSPKKDKNNVNFYFDLFYFEKKTFGIVFS